MSESGSIAVAIRAARRRVRNDKPDACRRLFIHNLSDSYEQNTAIITLSEDISKDRFGNGTAVLRHNSSE